MKFITREKDFYGKLYRPDVFDKQKKRAFHVSIGNAKNSEMHNFYPHAPEIKYVQDDKNTCVLSSLDTALFADN